MSPCSVRHEIESIIDDAADRVSVTDRGPHDGTRSAQHHADAEIEDRLALLYSENPRSLGEPVRRRVSDFYRRPRPLQRNENAGEVLDR
eukprot:SAG31_NODE_19428_length_600_cov_1.139165_1_plen_88_part_01